MCGIAGLIHRGRSGDIGREMTAMLQAMKHRGPDSSGFALYGNPDADRFILRFKVAEQEDLAKGFHIQHEIRERKTLVDARLAECGASVGHEDHAADYAFRYDTSFRGQPSPPTGVAASGATLPLVLHLPEKGRSSVGYQTHRPPDEVLAWARTPIMQDRAKPWAAHSSPS